MSKHTSKGVEWGERGSVRRKVVIGVAVAAFGAAAVAALPGPSPLDGARGPRTVTWGAGERPSTVTWG